MLGLVNDTDCRVELWMDSSIWSGEYFQCHPLVNTATMVFSKPDLERFFSLTGHTVRFFE
jgi:Ala-tRNA(Pro) deacylase